MPNGAVFVNSLLGASPTPSSITTMTLSATQASSLAVILESDAKDHFYSACTSLVDAIRGLQAGFYTWSTVKCYYSVFYSLRSLLAMDGICIVYVRRGARVSEFWIRSSAGCALKAERKERGTHRLTLEVFRKENAGHRLLSNPIDGVPPTTWLIDRREESNYRRTRFLEPSAPDHFINVESYGVRRLLAEYVADAFDIYTFQRDHAMLAYPLAALINAGRRLQTSIGIGFEDDEMAFLLDACCDKSGPLTPLTSVIRELNK